ncbi:MAG: DUF2971 domain-containing protein [Bryobacteraceae bacterium]|jgi:hypothetical protein
MSTDNNYLDIPAAGRDGFIYRIIKTCYLFKLLSTGKNVLVRPKLWDDPFENFILHSHFISNGEPVIIDARDHFYGQCWTFERASDAIWRIYSPNSKAVRIRSTIRRLAESLSSWRGNWAVQEAFIGRVRYLKSQDLVAFGNSVLRGHEGPLTHRTLARTLLVKRPAFKHEREVQLLFTPHDFHNFTRDLLPYPVEPNSLIDQVVLDPRMDNPKAAILKRKIRAAGFAGEIKRSLLYAPPPDLRIPWEPTGAAS